MFYNHLAQANPDAIEAISNNITETIDTITQSSFQVLVKNLIAILMESLPKIGISILVFLIGRFFIKYFIKLIRKILERSKINPTLHPFMMSGPKIALYIILSMICVRIIGIELTPLVAVLGAAGLALSLSVKDSLANIAGGMSLLLSRPFAKDDFVQISGVSGTVKELGIVYTLILTVDNKHTYLPNGDVAKATIVNFSAEPFRRIDLTFLIKETSDFSYAKSIILEEIEKSPLALAEPIPSVRITDQSLSHIKMTCYVWVKTQDIMELSSNLIGAIRTRISKEGL